MSSREIFKEVFAKLTIEQRNHIMSYFDRGESCSIEYEPGKFLMCHSQKDESLREIASNEYWRIGVK